MGPTGTVDDQAEFGQERAVECGTDGGPSRTFHRRHHAITILADRLSGSIRDESRNYCACACSAIFKVYAPDVAGDNPCCGPDHFVRVLSASSQPIPTRN